MQHPLRDLFDIFDVFDRRYCAGFIDKETKELVPPDFFKNVGDLKFVTYLVKEDSKCIYIEAGVPRGTDMRGIGIPLGYKFMPSDSLMDILLHPDAS